MSIFGIIVYIVICIFIMILAFKWDKRKKEKIKEQILRINEKNIKDGISMVVKIPDDSFNYEYLGKSYMDIIIERSLEDFHKLKSRLIKNIEKGTIAKTNKEKLIKYGEELIRNGNKKVEPILRELRKKEIITLEQLEIIFEEYKKDSILFCENETKTLYEEGTLKLYEKNLITDKELEKRKKFFYGDFKE
nr:MAG TPA: hypothetical protein [Caudoviricetes sp.]